MFLSFRRIVFTSIFTIALCFAGSTWLSAQEGEDLVDPVTPAATEVAENSGAQGSQNRVLELLFTGDPLGIAIIALIILLSFVSVYFIIEHMLSISKRKLMPEDVLAELEQRIARGEINQALSSATNPKTTASFQTSSSRVWRGTKAASLVSQNTKALSRKPARILRGDSIVKPKC